MENKLDSILKSDVANEQTAIGFMIQDERAAIEASRLLQSKYFYTPHADYIFKIIKSAIDEDKSPSEILFKVQSISDEDWEELSKEIKTNKDDYISKCMSQSSLFLGSTVAFEGLFEKIKNQYIRRKLISCYQEQLKNVMDTASFDDIETLADKSNQSVSQILDETDKTEIVDFKTSVLETLNKKHEKGISTGFQSLDKIIEGLKTGKLITLAAGTGKGKSAFAVNLALNVASQGYTVAIWSFEMGKDEVNNRMIDIKTGYSVRNESKREERYNAARHFFDNTNDNIQVFTNKIKTLSNLYITCRRLNRKDNMKVVIIDYLQLINLSIFNSQNRTREIEYITNHLKNMADELGITIIILSQLSREHLKREDKSPRLSDLRDSGSIEQDSNVVLFLHEPDIPQNQENYNGVKRIDLLVAKHREGRTGIVPLEFKASITKFREVEEKNKSGVIYSSQK